MFAERWHTHAHRWPVALYRLSLRRSVKSVPGGFCRNDGAPSNKLNGANGRRRRRGRRRSSRAREAAAARAIGRTVRRYRARPW